MNRRTMELIIDKLRKESLLTVSKEVKLFGAYREYKTTDRVINYVQYPETYRAKIIDVWDENKIILRYLRDFFRREGRLADICAIKIIQQAALILKEEPNVLEVQPPVNICGDIHGQYFDLLSVFEAGGGEVPKRRYLFLGDYVDRGAFSCEVMLYLFAMKINFPTSMYLLRGNHESRQMTKYYSFKRECEMKYSLIVYKEFIKAFECLPLAAIVGGRFFCAHAGIGPDLQFVSDIHKIDRFREIPLSGTFCDLVWSDPAPRFNQSDNIPDFTRNTSRKVSCYFSYRACCHFLRRNNLSSLVRAHSIISTGYDIFRVTESNYPSILGVFTAPNYIDVYGNKGAIVEFDGKAVTAIQFDSVSHPYYLPKLMDAFSFSLPFIAAKVLEIFHAILKRCSDLDGRSFDGGIYGNFELRKKVNTFGRLVQMNYDVSNYYTTLMNLTIDSPEYREETLDDSPNQIFINELLDVPEKCPL